MEGGEEGRVEGRVEGDDSRHSVECDWDPARDEERALPEVRREEEEAVEGRGEVDGVVPSRWPGGP